MPFIFNVTNNSVAPPTGGTFRVRLYTDADAWTEVSSGDTLEMVAPARVSVFVDQFADWAVNDPRHIHVETDMGERYDFQHTNHPDLPTSPTLLRPAGITAGLYPGPICGHSMRGTDMSGNQVLTDTYNGSAGPVGTLDQTIEVYVGDGLASDTLTFTLRLIDPIVYYADRTKATHAPTAIETARRGFIYVSRDGDFSDAPAERTETTTVAGIYHRTIADGEFDGNLFKSTDFPWGNYPDSAMIMFKAGEEFYPTATVSPDWVGENGTWGTWYHTGTDGDAPATLSYEKRATYDITNLPAMIQSTGNAYVGARFKDLICKVSDYDVSESGGIQWREWWNIIKYSGKTGTISENTSTKGGDGWTGETITNGSGVYAQVVSDDNVDTLVVRQVVDTANTDDPTAAPTAFTNGDTLTGTGTSDGTTLVGDGTFSATFVATGSRQDRTQKVPGNCFRAQNSRGLMMDNVQIIGAASGIASLGQGLHLNDCLISNCWNYGAQDTDSLGDTKWTESGTVTTQPLSYEGTPRDVGPNSSSDNRNTFNVMTSDDPTELALNNVSHAARRWAELQEISLHYCFTHWYGGHGSLHQPMYRIGTGGSDAEGLLSLNIYGCGLSGGNTQLNINPLSGVTNSPRTPAFIRIERTHLRAGHGTQEVNFRSAYTNYVVRNSIFDRPVGSASWDNTTIQWISGNSTDYNEDPDLNPVEPLIEFCTFTALLDTTTPSTVGTYVTDVRGITINYSNNAYVVDTSVFGSVDTGIAALADEPNKFSGFVPLATAKAYQSATGTLLPAAENDANGTDRTANPSQGAFEPS